MSSKRCCVPGCEDSGRSKGQTLHFFPNPLKEAERFKTWIMRIGGVETTLPFSFIHANRRVCHVHFEEKYHCRFNRISPSALPTLFMPETVSKRRIMVPLENLPHAIPSISNTALSTTTAQMSGIKFIHEKENIESLNFTIEQSERSIMTPIENIEHAIPSTSTASCEILLSPTIQIPKTVKKKRHVSKREITLLKKIDRLKEIIKKNVKANKKLTLAKKILEKGSFEEVISKFPMGSRIITKLQMRELKKKNRGKRYTEEEKIILLSLYKQSPKAYRYLRKILSLPAPATLIRIIRKVNLKPGINDKIFNELKSIATKLKPQHKVCALLFDEMSLQAEVSYNERKDKLIGFSDNGIETTKTFADHVLVFMIRGIFKNYKQPISYTFCNAATKSLELKRQINEIIIKLQWCGFTVVATVCDQGSTNQSAINLLINETKINYTQRGLAYNECFFLINGKKIVPLYDPPHLLKGIRNNFINKSVEFKIKEQTYLAKWQHVELLHRENPCFDGIRIIPKLTDEHIIPHKMKKMKVKYAAQLFSMTVGANMGYLTDKKVLPEDCRGTAQFLIFIDRLFDSFNGSFNKKSYHKEYLGAVKPKSSHHSFWKNAKAILHSIKFIDESGNKKTVPSVRNWIKNIDRTEYLLKFLSTNHNISSVWMRHLNQDPLENFFGKIRSHGARNVNPSCSAFESAFISILLNVFSGSQSPGANCEEDYCHNLHAVKLLLGDCNIAEQRIEVDIDDLYINIKNVDKGDPRFMGSLVYITGYFLRKVKLKVYRNCNKCNELFESNIYQEYIKHFEYSKSTQRLCYPSEKFLEVVSNIKDVVSHVISNRVSTQNLKTYIKTVLTVHISYNFIECNKHKSNIIKILENTCINFFIFVHCKNINKVLKGKLQGCSYIEKLAEEYRRKRLKRIKKYLFLFNL